MRQDRKRLLRLLGPAVCLICVAVVFQATSASNDILTQLWSLNSLHYSAFDERLQARVAPSSDAGLPLLKDAGLELLAPKASIQGGRFPASVTVALSASVSADTVRYSVDGSIPTRRSPVYEGPLTFASTTVLRFRSVRPGFVSSPTVTHTYVVGLDVQIPILSLVSEPVTLWNRYAGIYTHPREQGSRWARDAHLEYVPTTGGVAFATDGEVRIHGGASRGKPKKSFRFTFPLRDGAPDVSAPLFTEVGWRGERTVVLRAGGSNTGHHRIRDELFSTTYRDIEGFVSSHQPVLLLVNGEHWGLYDLREYVDADFLDRTFGHDEYDLLRPFGGRAERARLGSRESFDGMLEYFEKNDFHSDAAVAAAGKLIDIENITDYWITNIYAANLDWPHNNIYAVRSRTDEGARWRWISWDADATFDYMDQGLHHDTLAWAMRPGLRHDLKFNNHKGNLDRERSLLSTLIMRRLMQNEQYRKRFMDRLVHLLDTEFAAERMEQRLQSVVRPVLPALEYEWARWPPIAGSFDANLEQIRTFFRLRPAIVREHAARYFQLHTGETFLTEP